MRDDPPSDDDFRPPVPQAVEIPGPAGPLEARVEEPAGASAPHAAIGVVCHPHPLHGGTLQNKVVHTCARAMLEAGAATVRFNFRGVGRSAGDHAHGDGEIDDALGVVDWARRRFACDTVWLAGFSFGAAVALRAATRGARPARLVTVAPPVGRILTDRPERPECGWLIVQGDRDDLVDVDAVRDWAASYVPPPRLLVVEDAEHFFHGKLLELRKGVREWLVGK